MKTVTKAMKNLVVIFLLTLLRCNASSLHWTRSEIMDPYGLYILEWRVERKEIIFTTTVNTRGYIGLGFSYRHGHMTGSDLIIAWVDDQTGLPNILVSGVVQKKMLFLSFFISHFYSFSGIKFLTLCILTLLQLYIRRQFCVIDIFPN